MTKMIPIIGLMAGTSIDGIDAALVMTDGHAITRTPFAATMPYADETRAAIFALMDTPHDQIHQDRHALDLNLGAMIARDHANACNAIIAESGITPSLVGFHGQTILHDPDHGISIQLGNADELAQRLGCQVVHSFRQDDLKAGGQGAPLAPIYHQAIMAELDLPLPSAMVNIGGISNISLVQGGKLIGFDSGPGNALMDDAMRKYDGSACDVNGELAASGAPDLNKVAAVLSHEYFHLTGPKSLDRMGLYQLIHGCGFDQLPPADHLASLTLLTARSIIDGLKRNADTVHHLVVCGGGGLNPTLMAMINDAAGDITVSRMEDLGGDSRFIEAELMAYLAARSLNGLPLTFPNTTGVPAPQTGGMIAYP